MEAHEKSNSEIKAAGINLLEKKWRLISCGFERPKIDKIRDIAFIKP